MTLVLFIMAFVVIIMLLGVPVGFSFGLGGFAMLFITGLDPRFAIPSAFRNLESYTLLALPLFIMAGGLMRDADISKRLIEFTMSFLGRIKGGLGMVCVVSCTIFGAISGSASAAIAAIGSVIIPEMVEQGYDRGYSTGLVAASSMLALLIPPSIPMIVFAMTAQISILAAFLSTLNWAFYKTCGVRFIYACFGIRWHLWWNIYAHRSGRNVGFICSDCGLPSLQNNDIERDEPQYKELYDHLRRSNDSAVFYPDGQSDYGYLSSAPATDKFNIQIYNQ